MDISSKGGLPSQQNRAPRGTSRLLLAAENETPKFPQAAQRILTSKGVRPSTGRLTSPAQERGVALRGRITRVVASCCIARLVVLASEDPRSPIVVHVDSPGGSPAEAMSILSTMNGIHCPVVTFCRGEVFGPAAIIASHGLRGYRVATAGCRFSLKIVGAKEPARREAERAEPLLPLLTDLLVKSTRQPHQKIMASLTTGTPFSSQEALKIGLIDAIASEPVFPQVA
jgi:ATP-dependent Clp endopeptidase proteolytic subunit ClpP